LIRWRDEQLRWRHVQPARKRQQGRERRVVVAGLERLHVADGHARTLCKRALRSPRFPPEFRYATPKGALFGRGVLALFHGQRIARLAKLESARLLRYLLMRMGVAMARRAKTIGPQTANDH
jgi:hypothetical protein